MRGSVQSPPRWWEFWIPKLLVTWLQKIERVTFKSLCLFIFWFDSLLNSTAFCSQTRCGGGSSYAGLLSDKNGLLF